MGVGTIHSIIKTWNSSGGPSSHQADAEVGQGAAESTQGLKEE